MATKDFNITEDNDRGKKEEDLPHHANRDHQGEGERKSGPVIKNAHATGDGSFGRSESSLPEHEDENDRGHSTY